MKRLPAPPAKPLGQRAFTLVETVLALGIAGTALLVVFSLLPTGLSALQDSQRQIVETEIYNKIGSELATTAAYDTANPTNRKNLLTVYCQSSRFPAYFDAEGNELKGSASALTVFTVSCEVTPASGTVWSPAGSNSASGQLLFGKVRIGFHQNPQTASPTNVRQRVFLLSDHGT